VTAYAIDVRYRSTTNRSISRPPAQLVPYIFHLGVSAEEEHLCFVQEEHLCFVQEDPIRHLLAKRMS